MRVDDGCVSWGDGDGDRGRVVWGERLRTEQPGVPDDVVAMIVIATDEVEGAVYCDRSQAAFVAGSLAAAAGCTLAPAPAAA